ncbi:hypothetical protein [Reyranella massiliensis]|uniref:hypothetical protein n=1 Tax=Reyranella massiliensis TaxID=445220 RepID=UPI00030A7C70|nr:hypothetical protein [Reyranella massiliensis]
MCDITPIELRERADQIDNRLGPIPGGDADAIARELRFAAATLEQQQIGHDARVTELLAANTAEVERRRALSTEMREVRAAVANAHRLIRGDCPGAAGDVLRAVLESTAAYQVPATERADG